MVRLSAIVCVVSPTITGEVSREQPQQRLRELLATAAINRESRPPAGALSVRCIPSVRAKRIEHRALPAQIQQDLLSSGQ